MALEICPATSARWDDFERLAAPRGFSSDCWCMWWRRTNAEARSGPPAREAMHAIVEAGREPGLLAYLDGAPAGWATVAPREEYPRVARTRKLVPLDDRPAWAVPCFFVASRARRSGVAEALLEAAVAYARDHGASLIEGYPIDTSTRAKWSGGRLFTGTLAMFERLGFREVTRRGDRPIVRLD